MNKHREKDAQENPRGKIKLLASMSIEIKHDSRAIESTVDPTKLIELMKQSIEAQLARDTFDKSSFEPNFITLSQWGFARRIKIHLGTCAFG